MASVTKRGRGGAWFEAWAGRSFVGLALSVASACAAPDPEPVASSEGELTALRLTEADDGRTVVLTAGTPFAVDLPAYPSTGFEWALVETTDALGRPFRTRFFVDPDAEAAAQAAAAEGEAAPAKEDLGGRVRFYFRTSEATVGQHPLAFSYSSRYGAGAPLRAVRYVVDVQGEAGASPDAGAAEAGAVLDAAPAADAAPPDAAPEAARTP